MQNDVTSIRFKLDSGEITKQKGWKKKQKKSEKIDA